MKNAPLAAELAGIAAELADPIHTETRTWFDDQRLPRFEPTRQLRSRIATAREAARRDSELRLTAWVVLTLLANELLPVNVGGIVSVRASRERLRLIAGDLQQLAKEAA